MRPRQRPSQEATTLPGCTRLRSAQGTASLGLRPPLHSPPACAMRHGAGGQPPGPRGALPGGATSQGPAPGEQGVRFHSARSRHPDESAADRVWTLAQEPRTGPPAPVIPEGADTLGRCDGHGGGPTVRPRCSRAGARVRPSPRGRPSEREPALRARRVRRPREARGCRRTRGSRCPGARRTSRAATPESRPASA